jgi:ABC-type lipoprotein release transport system permease subunit
MWFYLKLAWRNIFRNKRRTIITSFAIGIGLASLIFTAALMEGMIRNMVQSATSSFLGEAQVHGGGFRETQEVEKTVNDLDRVTAELKQDPLVARYTLRTLSMGMVTSPANVNAVLLVGVDPGSERFLSKIADTLQKGSFFAGENLRDIVIGSNLAEELEVSLGDRVVATVSQAGSGNLAQEMFRISGIYRFGIKEMDSGMAFIRLTKAQMMLGIGARVHEIAIKFKDIHSADKPGIPFWRKYSRFGNEAVPWTTLLPQMKSVLGMLNISLLVMAVILGCVVVFGIINSLFMSLYERMFEFAVMRAVGTRPGGLRELIILEAGALAVISIVFGSVLGMALTLIFAYRGIDYRGIEFAGTTFHELIYPVMSLWHYIVFPVGVLLFTMLVAVYPAWVAGRLRIAAALRKSF